MAEINKSEAIRDHFRANPKAKAQEVVDALAKKGITVAANLVNTVKSKHNKRQAAKKAAKSKAKVTANKPEVSKSEAIRNYYKANPKAKTSEVIEALGKEGIKVSVSLVTTVKAKRKRRRKAVKQVVAAVAPTGIGVREIKAALSFIKDVGSVDAAKQALAAAVEIKKVV